MKRIRLRSALPLAACWLSLVSSPACSQPVPASVEASRALAIAGRHYPLTEVQQYKLPEVLQEISGLTLDDEQHLYGHDDERGVIYQIDFKAGRILKRFSLQGSIRADFEGMAWLDGHLYLVTSKGRLYQFRVGAMNGVVPVSTHTDGLACEVEGLSRSPDQTGLIAACKNLSGGKKALNLHCWQPGERQWSTTPCIKVKRSAYDAAFEQLEIDRPKKFQPTAVTVTPEGNLLLIAGPQKVLLEMTATGTPLAAAYLDAKMHRQPEGIAMTEDGTLIIADEGDNNGSNRSPGRLAVYRPASED